MQNFNKAEELFDSSKGSLVLPLVFTFASFVLEILSKVNHPKLKQFKKSLIYQNIQEIVDKSYLVYFCALLGIAFYSHYIKQVVAVYLILFYYVVFYILPTFHKGLLLRKRIVEAILLILLSVLLLLFVIDVEF